MKKISFLFLMMIFISGCYTLQTQSPDQVYHSYDRYYTFEIVSEPSGVKIEINNNYIGNTPISYTVKCDIDKLMFSYGVPHYFPVNLTINALPYRYNFGNSPFCSKRN